MKTFFKNLSCAFFALVEFYRMRIVLAVCEACKCFNKGHFDSYISKNHQISSYFLYFFLKISGMSFSFFHLKVPFSCVSGSQLFRAPKIFDQLLLRKKLERFENSISNPKIFQKSQNLKISKRESWVRPTFPFWEFFWNTLKTLLKSSLLSYAVWRITVVEDSNNI